MRSNWFWLLVVDFVLRAYPREHRVAYGEAMRADYGDQIAGAQSLGARLGVAVDLAMDLLTVAPPLHGEIFARQTHLALRTIRHERRLAAYTGLSLALAFGLGVFLTQLAQISVFRPLPFPDAGRLVVLCQRDLRNQVAFNGASPLTFEAWRDRGDAVLADISAYSAKPGDFEYDGRSFAATGLRVMGNYFPMMGVSPLLGRTFTTAETAADAPVVVLRESFWRKHFAGERSVVGRAVRLNGQMVTVIGVMPDAVDNYTIGWAQFWGPFAYERERHRTHRFLLVMARVRAEVTLEAARGHLEGITKDLARTHAHSNEGWGLTYFALPEFLSRQIREPLLLLSALAVCGVLGVLFNLTNLLLAYQQRKQVDQTIQLALGASLHRLRRAHTIFTVLLLLPGSTLGVVAGWFAFRGSLRWMESRDLATSLTIATDAAIPPLLPILGIAVVSSIGLGILLGWLSWPRGGPHGFELLKEGTARLVTSGNRGMRWRTTLVVVQFLVAAIILPEALAVSSALRQALNLDLGFDPAHLQAVWIKLPRWKVTTGPDRSERMRQLLAEIRALPAVSGVTVTDEPPIAGGALRCRLMTSAGMSWSEAPQVSVRQVTGSYFATMRLALVAGRTFNAEEEWRDGRNAVINEAAAKQFWPERALGAVFRVVDEPVLDRSGIRIVGVVRNERQSLESVGEPAEPVIYLPFDESPHPYFHALVRSRPGGALAEVGETGVFKSGNAVLLDQTSFDTILARELATRWLLVVAASLLALGAALIAISGVYGLTDYDLHHRRQEIGLRLALGASHRDLSLLFARRGIVNSLVGIALGLVPILLAAKLLQTWFSAVPGLLECGVTAILLLTASFAATQLPLYRRLRDDPSSLLHR